MRKEENDMKIDIPHIAKLARLHIDEDQLEKFEQDMESIVAMVDHLPEVTDTLTLDADNPMQLREDVAEEKKFKRDEILANAPEVQSGCLVVPKTVE
jgi:aspartyl-tRNA(Asn)/glutamyl-tRNA(Gln) amidotransferase subunit C